MSRKDTLAALDRLWPFIPFAQAQAMQETVRRSRELDATIAALAATIDAMPVTHGQASRGEDAIVHLHYFGPVWEWYVTEKYAGDPEFPRDLTQRQAFGLVSGLELELGYIGIDDIGRHPSSKLDLYWTPKTVSECRALAASRRT